MEWKIIISEEYESWFKELPQNHKISIATDLEVLKDIGPTLGRPYVDQIKGSKYNNLKELRTKVPGHVYRSLFAFDPERHAIILGGGDKLFHVNNGEMMKTLNKLLTDNFSSKERAEIRLKSKEKVASIRLQQVRKSHHVTQKELAKTMGLSQSALSELERRPNITFRPMPNAPKSSHGRETKRNPQRKRGNEHRRPSRNRPCLGRDCCSQEGVLP